MTITYLEKEKWSGNWRGEAGCLSLPGKVPNMAQEVMGSTASISKGSLAELDLQEHLDDPKQEMGKGRYSP